jgi:hypothetical protein
MVAFSAEVNMRKVLALAPNKATFATMDVSRYAVTLESALALSRGRYDEKGQMVCLVIQREWLDYLKTLPKIMARDVHTAIPADVITYMEGHWVPTHGRTHLPNGDVVPSFSYLKNCLTFLRRLFDDVMRQGDWNAQQFTGNPCASEKVSKYRSGYERMLWRAGIQTNAAAVLTQEQFETLADYLIGKLNKAIAIGASPVEIAIIYRDLMLICYLW